MKPEAVLIAIVSRTPDAGNRYLEPEAVISAMISGPYRLDIGELPYPLDSQFSTEA